MKFECVQLACNRGGREIFTQLGFCLPAASALIIKGANGSGKTSLIKILAGLLPADAGHAQCARDEGDPEWPRDICYIGHKNGLKLAQTVRQNLEFYATQDAISAAMLPAAMHYFDLEKYADVPCRELSSGWQRRTTLARLLFSREPVWLLDEPTNFLDEEAVLLFTHLVETRVNQGGIAIIASHTIQSHFASHVLHLEDFKPAPLDVSIAGHASNCGGQDV